MKPESAKHPLGIAAGKGAEAAERVLGALARSGERTVRAFGNRALPPIILMAGKRPRNGSSGDRTALRDFEELTAKGVLEKRGTTGRSIHYVLKRQTRHKPDKGDTE